MSHDAALQVTATDAPGPVAPAAGLEARNRLVIGLLLASAFVVILNETIMGVAVPSLVEDLSITTVAGQWLSSAFMLTMAVVIPVTGFLLQRLNTRPVFITAMSLFSLGTLVCAVAPGFGVLLIGRIVQASGTAIVMPLLMTTVLTLVPQARRGRVTGNISIVISVAPAIGPTISGLILSVLEWRWMFILVLPVALTALLIGALRIQNVTSPRPASLDLTSIVLSGIGFGGLVYGLSTIGEGAAATVPAWAPLTAGAVALSVFLRRQVLLQRTDRALLDLRTFTSRTFTTATAVLGLSMMTLFGTLIVLSIYLQNVHGLDPLTTGLVLLPGGLVMGLLAPVVGRAYDRSGPTLLLVPGTVIVSAVLWCLSLVSETTPVSLVLLAHVVLSAGLALMITPLFTSALGALPQQLYSHGSATVGTVQHLSAATGTALFVTVMALNTAVATTAGAPEIEATASGVQAAFLSGAIISLFAVAGSFRVRRPAPARPDVATPSPSS